MLQVSIPLGFVAAGVALTAYAPWILVGFLATRRIQKLEAQLADAIDLMLSALQAGVGVRHSLELVRSEKKAPIRDEFHELITSIEVGVPAPDAFRQWSVAVGSRIIETFAIAMGAKWDVGGNYSDMLRNMAERIRESIRLRRRVQSLTAEARFSAMMALLMPYAIVWYLMVNDPKHLDPLFESEWGRSTLYGAITLQILSILWIRKMVRVTT
jgi:tight adherence protein B